jgi:hypothetical protein
MRVMSIRMGNSTRWIVSMSIVLALGDVGMGGRAARAGEKAGGNAVDAAAMEFFENRVRPVLAEHCWGCHGPEKHKASLRLDSRSALLQGGDTGPAVVPGKPEESLLIEAVCYDGSIQMPPRGKLGKNEIDALTDWVKRGSPWPEPRDDIPVRKAEPASIAAPSISEKDRDFWSFRPVEEPAPPAVRDETWVKTPIDRFILARLDSSGLEPSPPADKRVLLRRVTFDLIGLPPTPEEIADFENDHSTEAFARVVDRLLASPHYGERWGRHWLDVARYGEDQAHSFQPQLYPYGFRYRDWLIDAFNQDMPYDRFLAEQIAGDLLEEPGREKRLAALGFFACGPVYYGDAKKHDQYADRIDTLTRGMLGLTVACARCHDHKYDPIPTTDYYALAGVFASTQYVEVPDAPKEQVEAYDNAQAAILKKTQEINTFLKHEAERLKLKVPRNQVAKMLPADSRKKLAALREEQKALTKKVPPKYPVIHTLTDAKQPSNQKVLIRGNADTPGPEVPRRFLTVLEGERSPFVRGSGRLELARAIASPSNPLTARVIVNRVWQHHFGRGLVATASNFGALGDRPSHPELLDWLASRFMARGWSLKALHREILLSSVYQQSSGANDRAMEVDPANTLCWRMNRRHLEVEAWRDAMLAVSGRLAASVGGPSASLEDASNTRRTCYAVVSRHDLSPLLRLFDFPDPNITSGGRVETTVPLQQLFVLNSEFVVQTARALVDRLSVRDDGGKSDAERIQQAYLWLYGRPARSREVELGRAFLSANANQGDLSRWERYAQVLLAANEFVYVD